MEVSSERVELAGGRLAVVLAGADTAQEMARLELPLAVVRRAELTPGPDPTLYLYGAAVCQAAEQSLALLAGLTSWSLLDPGPPRLRVLRCTPVQCTVLWSGQPGGTGLWRAAAGGTQLVCPTALHCVTAGGGPAGPGSSSLSQVRDIHTRRCIGPAWQGGGRRAGHALLRPAAAPARPCQLVAGAGHQE